MMRLNDFTSTERSSGILYINIYPVVEYPNRIKIFKTLYNESFLPGKWKKRIGNSVYYYGKNIKDLFEEVDGCNPLFGIIFRKYLLDFLSENIFPLWQLKELKSTLRIVKEITESYEYSNIIKLEYELIISVHHWQTINFGLIADLKINVLDRKTNQRISYPEIKNKYGENVRGSICNSVQAFHKHLTFAGKKYATAMRDKFNLITDLLKEAFNVSENGKIFETPDGGVKIVFRPLEIVEVDNDDSV